MSPSTEPRSRPITRDDLREGFASLQEDVTDRAESARSTLLVAGAAAVALVAAVAFLLGKRRGKKDKTYIEIRRV